MAITNGNGLWKRVGAVVGTITAVLVLYWQIDSHFNSKIALANTNLESKIVATLEQLQQRQDILRQKDDIKLLNLKIEVLQERIYAIEKQLRALPNDRELQRELEYKRQKLEEAKKELDRLLSS